MREISGLEPEEAEKVLMVTGLTRITIYPSSLAEAECGEGEHVGLMFSAHGGGNSSWLIVPLNSKAGKAPATDSDGQAIGKPGPAVYARARKLRETNYSYAGTRIF